MFRNTVQYNFPALQNFFETGRSSISGVSGLLFAIIIISAASIHGKTSAQKTALSSESVGKASGLYLLKAEMQDIEALVTASGAIVSSISEKEGSGDFSINPAALSRNNETAFISQGIITRNDHEILLDRGILSERFTSITDGIRQDFIIRNRISGTGELQLRLVISGAAAATEKQGISLKLPQGRKLIYRSLHVTDASGKVLEARMECRNISEIAILVNDCNAVYPVTIDPTISDADWSIINTEDVGGNSGVFAMVYYGGSMYFGGQFTTMVNIRTPDYIAKWDGSTWTSVGTASGGNLPGRIDALAFDESGNLYAGGYRGSNAQGFIMKWNGTAWTDLGTVNGNVKSIKYYNNNIYIAGLFTTPANRVAKWDGTSWSGLGSGLDNEVWDMDIDASGNVYVVGTFATAGGTAAVKAAKWTSASSAWSALGSGFNQQANGCVLDGSGNFYTTGYFTTAGGTTVNQVAKWNGTTWTSLGTGLSGTGQMMGVCIEYNNSNLYVGGYFHNAGGVTSNHIAKWNGTSWSALGSSTVDACVRSIGFDGSGNLYAGGDFMNAAGKPCNGIAKWDGSAWLSMGNGMGNSYGEGVYTMIEDGSGNIYAGGPFTIYDATSPISYIAKWNGSSWSKLGSGISSGAVCALAIDGTGNLYAGGNDQNYLGYVKKWNGTNWSDLGSAFDNALNTMTVDSSGNIYSGGYFTNYIAKWNGTNWVSVGSGMDNTVSILTAKGDTIFAGGDFTTAGGVSAKKIAKWNGSTWSALGAGMNKNVSALLVKDDTLFVGGSFDSIGTAPCKRTAKWNGVSWSTLGAGIKGYSVYCLDKDNSGNIYASGSFDTVETSTLAKNIAKWDGSSWSALGSGADGLVYSIHYSSIANKMYAGGNFFTAGNKVSPYFASVAIAPSTPVVSSVSVPSDATYGTNQNLNFIVNTSAAITVDTTVGKPRIALTIGAASRYAHYYSGSGTTALVFRYTTQTGDYDNNGITAGVSIEANGGTLRDGSSNSLALTLQSVGSTANVKVDAAAPSVGSVSVPSAATYKTGDALNFTVNFSEAVNVTGTPRIALTIGSSTVYAGYVSGSTSSALIFRYTIQVNDFDSDGTGVAGTIDLNSGTIKDAADNVSALTLNSVGSTAAVLVDAVAPAVSNVAVPSNATYKTGDALNFTVTFSEAVTVTGTPRIALTIGSSTVYAGYVSGSASSALVFRYTVQTNDLDNNGIGIAGTIDLNSATIKDIADNVSTLTLNSVGSAIGVLVDAVAPAVNSVAVPSDATYKTGDSLNVTVNYSEAVIVTGTPRIALTIGSSTVYATYVSGSTGSALVFRYVVQSNDFDNDGIQVTSPIELNSGTINDAAGNASTLTLNSISVTTGVLVDAVAPVVSSVTVPSDSTYKTTDVLDFSVNYNKTVIVTGTPRISLTIGSSTVYATYVSGSAGSALLFRYVVQSNDLDNDGIQVTGPLELNGGTIKDAAGNASSLTLNSIGATTGIFVDAVEPGVSSVTVPSNATYKASENLDFTVHFNKEVIVTGTPRIALTIGSSTVYAGYVSGSASSILVFRYTVQTNNFDSDGIGAAGAIDLNNGTIKDAADNVSTLTLNSVGSTTGVIVDAAAPAVSSVTVPSNATYKTGDSLNFTVNYSEAVTVTGTPRITLLIGSSTVYADYVSGSAAATLLYRYIVQANDLDNDGIQITGTLDLNNGTINDAAGNASLLALNSVGATTGIIIDAVAPIISNVAVPSDNTYKAGDTLDFIVNYNQAVLITGVPRITLTIGSLSSYAEYSGSTGGSALLFRYVVQNGYFDNNGIVTVSPVDLNSGSIKDAAGNNAEITFNNIGLTSGININSTDFASVTSVNVPADKIYVKGDTLKFDIQYNRSVSVTGTPEILVTIGDSVRYALTQSSSTLKSLLQFSLVLDSADADSNGITFSNAIILNGGTISDSIGNPAILAIDNSILTTGIIIKKAQTITFSLNTDSLHIYGDTNIVLTGSASSVLPLSFISSDTSVVKISNDTVQLIKAGIAVITAVQSGNGIFLPAASVTDTIVITKKQLIVTADKKSIIYGSPVPLLTINYSGYVNTDSENTLDTFPLVQCAANSLSNAGEYPIIVSGGVSSKYFFSYIGDTLTIQKATLIVKANDAYRFTGQKNPVFTLNYSGFVNSESAAVLQTLPVISCAALVSSAAGTYPVTVSGGEDENYEFSYTPGTLTVDTISIKSLSAITLTPDSLGKVNTFTICAPGINWDSINVMAISSDTTLIKNKSIILGGTDSLRTIMVIPEISRNGIDTITIIVSTTAGELVRSSIVIVVPQTPPSQKVERVSIKTEPDGTIDIRPLITWQNITGATNYKLEIATDSLFAQIKIANVYADTAGSDIVLEPDTKYYIAVTAGNNAGFGLRSDYVTGITAGIPIFSVLHGPVDGDSVEPTVKLVWYCSVKLKSIDLQLSEDMNFSSLIIDTLLPGTDRMLFTPLLKRNKIFYWRIRPYGAGGQGIWSSGWFVTRDSTAVGTTLVGIVTDTGTITIGTSDEVGATVLLKGTGDSGTVVRMDVTPVTNTHGLAPVTKGIIMHLSDSSKASMTIAIVDSLLPAGVNKSNARIYIKNSTGAYNVLWDVIPDASGELFLGAIPGGSFFAGFDTTAPKINDSTALTPQTGGSVAVIKGICSDEIANMKVTVFYRKGGSANVDSAVVTVNRDGSFNFNSAKSPLDNNGFEYWLAGSDGVNKMVLPSNDVPVKIQSVSATDSIRNLEWRLFSIPSSLTRDSITAAISNLGKYGRYDDWLLYSRTASGLKEFGTDLYNLTPGSAYWIKTWKKTVRVGIAEGTTTPVNKCFEISIPSKTWISFGNPYMFNVSWASVLDSSHLTSSELFGPYSYHDSAWVAPLLTESIDPFEGYMVYNATGTDQVLRIPSISADSWNAASLVKRESEPVKRTTLSWQIAGPAGRDHGMLFGFSNIADSMMKSSRLNWCKPESPETDVVQSWFTRDYSGDVQLMTDFVPSKDSAGAVWSLVVSGITSGSVYTGFVGNLESLPLSWQAVIIDRKAGAVHNLRNSGYSFIGAEKETVRNLELAVGSAEFVTASSRGIVSLPQTLALTIVNRNQMTGTVSLRFAIPQNRLLSEKRVTIDIVNLQGKIVKRLISGKYLPGYYTVSWKPSQAATAAGFFVIMLRMDKNTKNIPMVLVR